MALYFSSACFNAMGYLRFHRVKVVALEGSTALKLEEEKVKLEIF